MRLEGKTFGRLTVLYKTDKRYNGNVIWRCKCNCKLKREIDVLGKDLVRNHTKSCGCLGSSGEDKIMEILTKLNIDFVKEKTYEDLVNPKTNQRLRFDFYLPDYNCLIEYDGEQHFTYNSTGWNTKEQYEKTVYRDNIKNQYCIDYNIKLIRIPYTDFDLIDENYIKDRVG